VDWWAVAAYPATLAVGVALGWVFGRRFPHRIHLWLHYARDDE